MEGQNAMVLTLPASMDYALVARMALSGLGLLAGLDVDLIGDLRTVADECCDCLLHQPAKLREVQMRAQVDEGRLRCCFSAARNGETTGESASAAELTLGILETLLPDVSLHTDEQGVYQIEFSMAV